MTFSMTDVVSVDVSRSPDKTRRNELNQKRKLYYDAMLSLLSLCVKRVNLASSLCGSSVEVCTVYSSRIWARPPGSGLSSKFCSLVVDGTCVPLFSMTQQRLATKLQFKAYLYFVMLSKRGFAIIHGQQTCGNKSNLLTKYLSSQFCSILWGNRFYKSKHSPGKAVSVLNSKENG